MGQRGNTERSACALLLFILLMESTYRCSNAGEGFDNFLIRIRCEPAVERIIRTVLGRGKKMRKRTSRSQRGAQIGATGSVFTRSRASRQLVSRAEIARVRARLSKTANQRARKVSASLAESAARSVVGRRPMISMLRQPVWY